MNPKLLTISGYRGIVDQTFTTEVVEKLITAFGQLLKTLTPKNNQVLICRDGRPGGKKYLDQVVTILTNNNFDVLNADILPTPLAFFAVKKFGLAGAVIITASHNPIEYNGLKFVGSDGLFISADNIREIKKLIS